MVVVAALDGRDDFEGLAVFLAELGDRMTIFARECRRRKPAGGQVGAWARCGFTLEPRFEPSLRRPGRLARRATSL